MKGLQVELIAGDEPHRRTLHRFGDRLRIAEATLAALKATSSIPIVMSAGDLIGAGLVARIARPGRNVTGLSAQTAGGEVKRLELLKELRPNILQVAVLSNLTNPY